MNFPSASSDSPFTHSTGCHATLTRLIGNLRGFVYRRRPDARWTMEYVSPGCHDLIGFEPHRFIANASIAFGDLIDPADRRRADDRVRLAVLLRRRVSVDYRIRTAHGALVQVEDRLTPVFSANGKVLAIEGVIDLARFSPTAAGNPPPVSGAAPLAARLPIHFAN